MMSVSSSATANGASIPSPTPHRPGKDRRQIALLRQVARIEQRTARLQQLATRLANVRLAIFLLALPVLGISFFAATRWLFFGLLVAFIGMFGSAVQFHFQVDQRLRQLTTWLAIKRSHLARMSLDWARIPPSGLTGAVSTSLDVDLDLYMLHRLVDTATSLGGSQRLFSWMVAPELEHDVIKRRQQLVGQLIPLTLFRDKLTLYSTLAGQNLTAKFSEGKLLGWLRQGESQEQILLPLAAMGTLSLLTISLFIASLVSELPPYWGISWGLYVLLFIIQGRHIGGLFREAMDLLDVLRALGEVTHFLEKYRYGTNQALRRICAPVIADRPSRLLRQVAWIASGASLQNNPYLWFAVNTIIPWDIFFAYQLQRYRELLAQRAPTWLDVWHELEALGSLATFAYLNPAYTFPELIDQNSPTAFNAYEIGHPLIPDERRVANDFSFDGLGQIVIITGSNMAGKSSFLRTLGVNLALAYAGGVVSAKALQTCLFRLFTCIRITDSLEDGISYFYAEVKRLKELLVMLQTVEAPPVFFLIDEIFRGTNNRERLIGSRGYVRALTGANGLGVIATHDLELTALAEHDLQIQNYHFREEVIDGRMVFDYRLRQGPCPTTNALTIMQLEGLPVNTRED